MNRKQANSQRGSSLALVLIFMTLMLVLGTTLIAASQYGAQQSASLVRADRHYYAAESGAQLAAQIFLHKLKDGAENEGYFPSEEDIPETEEELKAQLLASIGKYYEDMVTDIESQEFNGETVTIGSFGLTEDDIDFRDENDTITVSLSNFIISATSGGRTVTLETNAGVSVSVTSTQHSASDLPGVYFEDNTGGIYGDDEAKKAKYEEYIKALKNLLSDANTKYSAHEGAANVIPNGLLPSSQNFDSATAGTEMEYIHTGSPVTLGKAGTTTVYPNLKYLKTGSSVRIIGNVELPELEGIVAYSSASIEGSVNFPKLENFFCSGSVTIKENAKINPDVKPSGECNFYSASPLKIYCPCVVNWCRFYFVDINIYYGNRGKFTSNSMFFPRSNLNMEGTASDDTSGVIPQFYVPSSYIKISKDIGTFAGIFMTTNTSYVVNNGNGCEDGIDLIGLFVGNFNVNWPPAPIPNSTVSKFGPEELKLLMDGGITRYLENGGVGGPSEVETSVDFGYDFKGLYLRETTGEE